MDPKSGVHFWVRCAHRAEKVDPVFRAERCAAPDKEHRMDPKSGFHFGSDALEARASRPSKSDTKGLP